MAMLFLFATIAFSPVWAQDKGPIKIRYIAPLTGAFPDGASTGRRWIVESIKAVGGASEDRERLLAAMRKIVISEAPRGPFRLDDYGNPP